MASRVRLFYQIAIRLAMVAALFAVLEVTIVVVMYVGDPETLGEDLVSLESSVSLTGFLETGFPRVPFSHWRDRYARGRGVRRHGNRLLVDNPGRLPRPAAPLPNMQSTTSREIHGEQFFLTGIRRVDVYGRPLWIGMGISDQGRRPFLPGSTGRSTTTRCCR